MNDAIIYRPYKTQSWAIVFTLIVGMLAFVCAGYFIPFWGVGVLGLIGVGIVCIWLAKELYDSSKRAIVFEQNGLRIVGSCFEYHYIPLTEFKYGCYTRNYKGHLFLLLSPNELNSKAAKRFANRGANSSRIFIDGVVVIYLDVLQGAAVAQIKNLIESILGKVETY